LGSLIDLPLNTWFWAVISGLVYYALAFWFYITGLKRMSATEAGMYLNLIPIFGVVGACIFLGDRLTPIQWIGAIFILFAVFAIAILQKYGLVLRNNIGHTEGKVKPDPSSVLAAGE